MPRTPRPIRPTFRALAWVFGVIFMITGTVSLGVAVLASLRGDWPQVWWSLPLALGGAGTAVHLLPAAWTGLDLLEIEDAFEDEEG